MPIPGKRNVSALLLGLASGAAALVDCGEATQHQLGVCTAPGAKISRISHIYITHLHLDHCAGIFGLVASLGLQRSERKIELVGPEGIARMVETIAFFGSDGRAAAAPGGPARECGSRRLHDAQGAPCDAATLTLPELLPHLSITELPLAAFDARRTLLLPELEGIRVRALPLEHGCMPAWGFVFREQEQAGALDVQRATALGVPKGPELGQLKAGQDVTLADGRVVRSADVTSAAQPGLSLGILQDTMNSDAVKEHLEGVSLLIHEATFERSMKDEALAKGHSTSEMAAQYARAVGARALCLTHLSARYAEGPEAARILLDEAREVFDGAVCVAEDFMVLERRGEAFAPELQVSEDGTQRAKLFVKRAAW